MNALEMVRLPAVMAQSSGHPDVRVALIDGPVATELHAFAGASINILGSGGAMPTNGVARLHGTFVAGMLAARRGSGASAICPNCTLLVRPIFTVTEGPVGQLPAAAPDLLASAIHDCIGAGARVINLSLALAQPSTRGERALEQALDRALRHQVIVVAAAGNQQMLGSTAITRHPWVVPVVACDASGRPTRESNLGQSIARSGVRAPGEGIIGIGPEGRLLTLGGTSVAAPFVAGTAALLFSIFSWISGAQLRLAMICSAQGRRSAVVPPLLDAAATYQALASAATAQVRRAPSSWARPSPFLDNASKEQN